MYRRFQFKALFCFLRTNCQWSTFAAAWIILLAASLARGDSELMRSRFLEEYQPHAAQLEERYSNIVFDFIATSDAGAKKQISQSTGKFSRRNYLLISKSHRIVEKNTGKVLQEYECKGEGEVIDGRNALYSFALRPGEGGEHVLRDLTIYDATQEPAFCFLTAPYASWEDKRTYSEIAQDPKTHIIAFADRVWQGRPMKALECKFSKVHPTTHKPVEVTRIFYFAPDNGWVCCGMDYGSDPNDKEYLEQIYFYEPELGEQLPKLKRWEKWLRNRQDPGASKLQTATDITEFRRTTTPFSDKDFTLSAFGLPEPMGVEQPEPPRTWIWLIIAAIGAGLIAVLFAYLKRRQTTTNTAKT